MIAGVVDKDVDETHRGIVPSISLNSLMKLSARTRSTATATSLRAQQPAGLT
jgi:hypothetical protein